MAKQVLQSIKQTEDDAAKIRRDAAEKAERMVYDARHGGEEKIRLAEEQTKQSNRQMLAQMKQKADELSKRSRKEAEDEAARLESSSEAALDAAADVIIDALKAKATF